MTKTVMRCRAKPSVLTCSAPIDRANAEHIAAWSGGRVEHEPQVAIGQGLAHVRQEQSVVVVIERDGQKLRARAGERLLCNAEGAFFTCAETDFASRYDLINDSNGDPA